MCGVALGIFEHFLPMETLSDEKIIAPKDAIASNPKQTRLTSNRSQGVAGCQSTIAQSFQVFAFVLFGGCLERSQTKTKVSSLIQRRRCQGNQHTWQQSSGVQSGVVSVVDCLSPYLTNTILNSRCSSPY